MSRRLRPLICAWFAGTLVGIGCHPPAPVTTHPVVAAAAATAAVTTAAPAPPARPGRAEVPLLDDAEGRLDLKVPTTQALGPPATVAPLDAAATAALLARLEPLPAVVTGELAPPMPPRAAPPPTGPVTAIAFAAPQGRAVTDQPVSARALAAQGVPIPPLAPPEIAPSGEVHAEREIRIRFAEPMVAVAAIGPIDAPPVTLTPAVAGSWRWVDTHVLQFTPVAGRLPGATTFTVTVAAGTRAVSTAALAAPTVGTFTTAPIAILDGWPRSVVRTDSALMVHFTQDLDPAAVLPFLHVEDSRHRPLPFRLIDDAEARARWARNPSLDRAAPALDTRYLLLAPTGDWPAGHDVDVTLRAGAPSAEGPRRSAQPSAERFTIAAPFTLAGLRCGDQPARLAGARCEIEGIVTVEFHNPIDEASYHAPMIQLAGEPFEDHPAHDTSTDLTVPKTVGKAYTVEIADGLRDRYGQPLVGPRRSTFTTTRIHWLPDLEASTGLYVLDPRFTIPQWSVRAEAVSSVRIELYKVAPTDFAAFQAFEEQRQGRPPGTRIVDQAYPIGPRHGANLRIDLRPALTAGLGHIIAIATTTVPGAAPPADAPRAVAWIEVSRLGLTARVDGERVHAWVADVSPHRFLTPIAGATASLLVDGHPAETSTASDAAGQVGFALPPPTAPPKPRRESIAQVVVTDGADSAFAVLYGNHFRAERHDAALWYATDDRFTYKPGEPVYLKGWVRWTHDGTNPGRALPRPGETVAYDLTDHRGRSLAHGAAPLTDQGGFDIKVTLPKDVELGTATFQLTTRGASHRHPIAIQDFRTPAFAVTLEDDLAFHGARPLVVGEALELRAAAKYYAGGGLAGAGLSWDTTLTPTGYQPPGWDAYAFTPPQSVGQRTGGRWRSTYRASLRASREATLGGDSAGDLTIAVPALPDHLPAVLTIDATVADVDRMHIRASSRPILVHPSERYVGLRPHPKGGDELEVIVTDVDGHPTPGVAVEVEITAVLGSERGRDDAKVQDSQRCALTSTTTAVSCPWHRGSDDWAYTAIATVHDARGRANAARYDLPWWNRRVGGRDLAIIPDRALYRPGDVAHLTVRSEIIPATALVSFARQGVIAEHRIELTKPATVIDVPLEIGYLTNLHVDIDRLAPRRPASTSGAGAVAAHTRATIDLPLDVEAARLSMTATPTAPLVEPGAPATFDVEVRRDDRPVAGAEVALMVIDEAVLALSSRKHEDPLAPFYRAVVDGTRDLSTVDLIRDEERALARTPGVDHYDLDASGRGHTYGGGYGSGSGSLGAGSYGTVGHGAGVGVVTSRKDFRATAAFAPVLHTDAAGRARLTVTMPDSLTRFRIVALATADTHYFGKAEGTIITQRLLNARIVAPRFLNQGDAFALPVVVQNLDAQPRTIDVAVRAANLAAVGPRGQRVTLAAGQRAEVRFGFATAARGQAAIQAILTSGTFADAQAITLPIYEPATTESFASYGTVDDAPRFEQLAVPAKLFPDVGGVELDLATSQLQRLTDALWYLQAYPYECAEQRSARMIATSALADILDAFTVPGRPTRDDLAATATKDLEALVKTQLPDGGWGYFAGMRADPFVTNQVLTAVAKAGGPAMIRALPYVTREVQGLLAGLERAAGRGIAPVSVNAAQRYEVSLAASALAALAATGRDVTAQATRLHAVATKLAAYPIDAQARVLAVLATPPGVLAGRPAPAAVRQALLGKLLAATHETAAGATVTTDYVDAERLLLVSHVKTDALVLDALLREAPRHDLVTKLTHGLLDAQRRGRWGSTQDNLAALLALRRYFDTFEHDPPHYTGKAWIGGAAYAEQAFADRTTPPVAARLGWRTLAPGSTHDVAITKDGLGRMYYRLGVTYAPRPTDVAALEAGFLVRRSYEPIDDPADVTRAPDGRVHVRLGARVHVVVEALTSSVRHGVALVDPLPAGLEPVNTALANAERAVASDDDYWDHRELRDTRAEAFRMELPAGAYRFSYTARATTPGTFIAAPAKAEEMYAPETFGRTAPVTMIVE